MTILETERGQELLSRAFFDLKTTLRANGSSIGDVAEQSLYSVLQSMVLMALKAAQGPFLQLSSLEPGAGKTEAVCAFIRAWRDAGFVPDTGALIVLATHKEIQTCIHRTGLEPNQYAVRVANGDRMNSQGLLIPEAAPVLFTTQEKLRRDCAGRSFAETNCLHYRGNPRALRIWDEVFLPGTPVVIRKDLLRQPLADLRPVAPEAAAVLEALGDSLGADTVGKMVRVPPSLHRACTALSGLYAGNLPEAWGHLKAMAGQEGIVTDGDNRGLHLAGTINPIPIDFAPALILDASGRVRETYRTMEATGTLRRLPGAPADYRRLRVHHWDRAASRSALKDPKARQEVLEAVATTINTYPEPWLVIHPMNREADGFSITQGLSDLVDDPDRLSFVHWGNHHGTNDFRDLRKVMVLGLWNHPEPVHSARHLAAGGDPVLATDRETLEALKAGEHRHHLLQAICRASVRTAVDGACGDCEVFIVGKLGTDPAGLLLEIFPGAMVDGWRPEGHELSGCALKVAEELEAMLAGPGVSSVAKGVLRAALGWRSPEALAKVLRRTDFRAWAERRGIELTARAICCAS